MPTAEENDRILRPAANAAGEAPPFPPTRRGAAVTALLTGLLVVLPFLAVRFPPITDLPQQLAQVELAGHLLDSESPYRFNPLAPGILVYALLALTSVVAPPFVAGRLGYALLALLWVAGFALLLGSRRRSQAMLPLAATLFFSHALYWGFASFLLGASLFCGWIALERRLRAAPGGGGEIAALACGLLVLYSAHAFWCLAAGVWLVTATLAERLDSRRRSARLATLLPPMLLGVAWSSQLAASGFASETTWWTSPLARLAPGALVDRVFGGLRGPVEPVLLAAIVAWVALALLAHRSSTLEASDRALLVAACLCLAAAFLLPDRHQNTLQFAGRWAPVGVAFLLTASPLPAIRSGLRHAVPLVLLATLSVATVAAWQRFERQELSGLEESLAAVPAEPALLGLDFIRLSELVETQPFFQIPAYAQVLNGGTLGFSFASFPTSPVVFREWQNPPWTPGLEWLPYQILDSPDDLGYFDVVLVNASPAGHDEFARLGPVVAMTAEGRWRLYRVIDDPGTR